MKKLIGLVVILAALVLGGCYVAGIITERTVKHNLIMINKSNGLYVNLVEYHRGWFTSKAILDWRLHVPEHNIKTAEGTTDVIPPQDYEMNMPLNIHHGPVIVANKSVKFGLGYASTNIIVPDQYKEKFNTKFTSDSTQPHLNLNLFVTYLTNSQIELDVPSFKLIAKEGGQFDWMGMDSSITITSDVNKIKGDLKLKGMQFKKDDMTAIVGEVSSDYDLHQTTLGLFLGDANMSSPSFIVNNKDKKIFEINDFDVHSSSDIDDGLFNMHFKTTVDKIMSDDKSYGPGTLEMAIRNLDAVVLGHINEQINAAQQGTDQEKQQVFIQVVPELPKLLSRGAEFEISELSFVMPEGTIEGDLSILLPKLENANPFELMQKIEGNGKVRIPSPLLKLMLDQSNKSKVEQQLALTTKDGNVTVATAEDKNQQVNTQTNLQIQSLVQSGFLVQDGDYYVVNVVLKQGKFEVNGKPFEPGMLKI